MVASRKSCAGSQCARIQIGLILIDIYYTGKFVKTMNYSFKLKVKQQPAAGQ